MIVGIGIDAVEVEKCAQWAQQPPHTLERVFSPAEISYSFAQPRLTAQRLAARFAAREAFFKALAQANLAHNIPFLTLCKRVEVTKAFAGAPMLTVDWQRLIHDARQPIVLLSLTHTSSLAMAYVLLHY